MNPYIIIGIVGVVGYLLYASGTFAGVISPAQVDIPSEPQVATYVAEPSGTVVVPTDSIAGGYSEQGETGDESEGELPPATEVLHFEVGAARHLKHGDYYESTLKSASEYKKGWYWGWTTRLWDLNIVWTRTRLILMPHPPEFWTHEYMAKYVHLDLSHEEPYDYEGDLYYELRFKKGEDFRAEYGYYPPKP